MPDRVGALTSQWDGDEGPSAAEVFRVSAVLRPAAGGNLDFLGGIGCAGDAVERAVGQILERQRICLERDGFVWVRSA